MTGPLRRVAPKVMTAPLIQVATRLPGRSCARKVSLGLSRSTPVNRREFLTTAGAVPVLAKLEPVPQTPNTASAGDRDLWVATMRRLADPVLTNLADGTLKARMPVEQAAGADRRSVTHLEALGRLLAGIAPWLELPPTARRRTAARPSTPTSRAARSRAPSIRRRPTS